jgi:hypothetical protein
VTLSSGSVSATDFYIHAASGVSITNVAVSNLQVENTTSGAVTIVNNGTLTLRDVGRVETFGGAPTLLGFAVSNPNGPVSITTTSGAMNINASVGTIANPIGSAVTLTGDDIAVNAAVNAGANTVTLAPYTAGIPVTLGGVGGGLNITDAEMDLVNTTGALRVGASNSGALTVVGNLNPASATQLTLISGSTVGQTFPLVINNLRVQSVGAVSLTSPNNNVNTLSGSVSGATNAFSFTDVDNLTIGTVDTVSGITTSNGPIRLTVGGTLNQTAGLLSGSHLRAQAATGMTNLSSSVNTAQLNNTTSGNITLTNNKALTLQDVDAQGWCVQNVGAGTITVSTSASSLYLYGDVATGSGAITLTGSVSLRDDGLDGTEITTSGAIVLRATNGTIGQGAWGGSLTSTAGYVDVASGYSSLDAQAARGVFVNQVSGASLSTSSITNFNVTGTPDGSWYRRVGLSISSGVLNIDSDIFQDNLWYVILSASGNITLGQFDVGAAYITIMAGGSVLDDLNNATYLKTTGGIDIQVAGGQTIGGPGANEDIEIRTGYASATYTVGGLPATLGVNLWVTVVP